MKVSIVDKKLNATGIHQARYRNVVKKILAPLEICNLEMQFYEENCYPLYITAIDTNTNDNVIINMWPNGDNMCVTIDDQEYSIPF